MAPAKAEAMGYEIILESTVVHCANHYTAIPSIGVIPVLHTDAHVVIFRTSNIGPVTATAADQIRNSLAESFCIRSSETSADCLGSIGFVVAQAGIQTCLSGIDPTPIFIIRESSPLI